MTLLITTTRVHTHYPPDPQQPHPDVSPFSEEHSDEQHKRAREESGAQEGPDLNPDRRWRVPGKKAPRFMYMDRSARQFASQTQYQHPPEQPQIPRAYMHTEDPLDSRLYDDEYDMQQDPFAWGDDRDPPPRREPQEQDFEDDVSVISLEQEGIELGRGTKRGRPEDYHSEEEDDYLPGDRGFSQRIRFSNWENYIAQYETLCTAVMDEDTITFVKLVGKARSKEAKYHQLTKEEMMLFDMAIKKEWDMWELYQATRPLTDEELKNVNKGV